MAAVAAGFHTERWARGVRGVGHARSSARDAASPPFAAPLGPDPDALAELAASDGARGARAAELDELVGDRKLVLRSDRIDPSKNIVRGFLAYDELLDDAPGVARARRVRRHAQPVAREPAPSTSRTRNEVEQAAHRVNERWATRDWQPVVLDTRDDYAQTVAGFTRYDVLLVNPVKDGLNLVAKEGPLAQPARRRAVPLTRGRRVRRAARRGARRAPVRPRAGRGARCTPRSSMPDDERAPRAAARCARSPRVHTPRTWLDELLSQARAERVGELVEQRGEARGPVDHDVGGADLAADSRPTSPRCAPRARARPSRAQRARARRTRAGRRRRRRRTRRPCTPAASSATAVPLSTGTGGRSSTAIRPRSGASRPSRVAVASAAHAVGLLAPIGLRRASAW